MAIEIDIKSSTIDKTLEIAKEFLGKLISPTITEFGLLHSDNARYKRFKNQVEILLKAKEHCESNNISIKTIPIKILVPLLENASLEEEEIMQDIWAKMITNMVDSETNLQNHIFPFLLSQISLTEFNELKNLIKMELKYFEDRHEVVKLHNKNPFIKSDLERQVYQIEQEGFRLNLEGYEHANLVRLGLIKQLPPKIFIEEFRTGGYPDEYTEKWHQIDAEYNLDSSGYRVTDLGEKFIEVCELGK